MTATADKQRSAVKLPHALNLRLNHAVPVVTADGTSGEEYSLLASKGWILEIDEARGVARIWSGRRATRPEGTQVTTVPLSWCAYQLTDDLEAT